MNIWQYFSSKFALGISNVLLFRPVIWSAISSLFRRTFFALSNQKPIQIIETVKQIGRYLIRYTTTVFCNLG